MESIKKFSKRMRFLYPNVIVTTRAMNGERHLVAFRHGEPQIYRNGTLIAVIENSMVADPNEAQARVAECALSFPAIGVAAAADREAFAASDSDQDDSGPRTMIEAKIERIGPDAVLITLTDFNARLEQIEVVTVKTGIGFEDGACIIEVNGNRANLNFKVLDRERVYIVKKLFIEKSTTI